MSRFWEYPIVRNMSDDRHEHRHVTWLELLYDLAFVVAIAVVGHEFAKHTTVEGFITFAVFFIAIWWAWLGDAFYNNRFDPEDHGHQLLTIIQMFGIIGIAIFAHMGLTDGYVGFVLSYVLVRFILAFLSYRVGKYNKFTRRVNYFTAKTIALAAIVWLISIFFPEIRFLLLVIALAIDLISPIMIAKEQQKLHINAAHMTQRFGFFIIIMLGEVLAAVARSVNTIGPSPRQLILGALSIALSFCIWWFYFENDYGPQVIKNFFIDTAKLARRTTVAGYVWTYTHLPLGMGIMAAAVGIERIIIHGPNATLSPERIFLLSFGIITAILSIGVMQITAMMKPEKFHRLEHVKMILPFISVIIILLITKTTYSVQPMVFLSLLVAVCFAQIFVQEVIEHQLKDHAH